MRHLRKALIALAAGGLLAAACGSSSDGGGGEGSEKEPMTGRLAAFKTGIIELQDLVATHDTAVQAAADLAAIATVEADYAPEAGHHHEEIHHALEDMAQCSHDGHPPHTDQIEVLLPKVEKELNVHTVAMGDAADVAAALVEEQRHQKEVGALLGDLLAEHDELAPEAGDHLCPHDEHGGTPHAH